MPQISADHGPVRRRRGVLARRMTDFIFMVTRQLLHVRHRPGRGEDGHATRTVTAEELGGARHAHRASRAWPTSPSTTTWKRCSMRAPLLRLPAAEQPRRPPPVRRRAATAPTATDLALDTLVPGNPNKPYDMQRADPRRSSTTATSSSCSRDYAKNIIVGFAPHRRAQRWASSANQPHGAGRLPRHRAQSSKAARFVRFCDCLQHPAGDLRRRARLPARHRPGVRRHHQARRQAALRLLPRPPCPRSPSSPARPTAAPTT
jgi:propionyl-CoA carboxylase beta chain